jgi:hypothetical protein
VTRRGAVLLALLALLSAALIVLALVLYGRVPAAD